MRALPEPAVSHGGVELGLPYGARVEQPHFDAVVLAGGRARRAGGHKLGLRRDGRTLLEHAVDSVAGAGTVVVVGPEVALDVHVGVVWRREDPPYGGPVAAISAALGDLSAPWVIVVAGDLPHATPAVRAVLAATRPDVDAAIVVDADGVRQPLLAAYDAAWLRSQVARGHAAAQSLLDGARVAEVTDVWQAASDVDTPADAADHGFGPP